MTHLPDSSPGNTPTQPSGRGRSWGAIIGIVVLGLVGFAMLAYAIFALTGSGGSASPTTTQIAAVPTRAVLIPTITSAPPTQPPTVTPPTDTPPPAATQPPAGPVLNILQPANIRSGPGLNYPVIGGMQAGATADAIGRDASAQWYVINYSGSVSGQGWVSTLVSSYTGDTNSLPVIAAPPPPPPPTNTPVPIAPTAPPAPTNPPAPSVFSSHGIVGNSFSVENLTVGAGQDIWFDFQVTNTSDVPVSFAVLSAHIDNGPSHDSWTNYTLPPHQKIDPNGWRDHININTPGTYQIYLGICYGDKNACLANQAPWDRLSNSVTVIVK